MFLALLVSLCSLSQLSLAAQQSCPMPPKLKTPYDFNWKTRENEWSNVRSRTDYLRLTLAWTPSYCMSLPNDVREREFQCTREDAFSLIIHGLWPQAAGASSVRDHPRNCRDEQSLPSSVIKRFFCLMPDENLMQKEWEKHGSCYFETSLQYFTVMENLYNQLNIPDIRAMKRPTAASIKSAFLALNSPKLFASAIIVHMDAYGQLREIYICYDLSLRFLNCNQGGY